MASSGAGAGYGSLDLWQVGNMQDLWRGFGQTPLLDAAPHACSPLQTPVLYIPQAPALHSRFLWSVLNATCLYQTAGLQKRATWGDYTGLGCEHCEHETRV